MARGTKRALLLIAGVVAALAVLILALPFLIPVETYRGQIEQAANTATGRTLHIAGPLRLTIFPQLGLSAGDASFSNKSGGIAADMASAAEVQISVELIPLLTGAIRVAKIILDRPVIHLEVDKNGDGNWTFAAPAPEKEGGQALPEGLHFAGIEIIQGKISYANAVTGISRTLENLDASIDITDQNKPVAIKGRFTKSGRPVDFNGQLSTPQTLSNGETTALTLALTGDLLRVDFKGEIASDRALTGSVHFTSPSLRDMGTWLGLDMPSGGGLKAVALDGQVHSKDGVTSITDMRLAIDGATIQGDVSADTNPDPISIKGKLSADRLDLNAYMQAGSQSGAKTGNSGWSVEPLALDGLKKFNADLALSTGSLTVRSFRIGRSSLTLHLENGVLRADLDPVSLYGGIGHAAITVDVRQATPQIHNVMAFNSVTLSSLLGDAIGVNKIEGDGNLVLDVSTNGRSANALMHALSGKGSLAVGKGRIRGVNLGMVARTIQTVLSGAATGDAAATEFSQINGSFVIANGVLANSDFRLAGPGLNATGAGTIDVGNQTMDFKIIPKADIGVANIAVPFRISGSWSSLKYRPDLEGLATGVVKGLIQSPKNAKDLLGNILGSGKSEDGKSSNPLGGLFGR